jgi:bifunctional non-homologous end joining protein LigD
MLDRCVSYFMIDSASPSRSPSTAPLRLLLPSQVVVPPSKKRSEQPAGHATQVLIEGRRLRVTNLDKVLYPVSGFTKGQVVDYYARIAPFMLPHLLDRPVTMLRLPDGVTGERFFEKRCPGHRPEWVDTVPLDADSDIAACSLDTVPALVWTANLAALELHTPQAQASDPWRPTAIVFDLDPGPGADLADCARVALELHDLLDQLGLRGVAKTSGAKGLHLSVGLRPSADAETTKAFALALGKVLESRDPKRVTVTMARDQRGGRVFVDWSQNDRHKTTVCAYSLRASDTPGVSTPVSWDELRETAESGDARALVFEPADVLARVEDLGDLYADSLAQDQDLPQLG